MDGGRGNTLNIILVVVSMKDDGYYKSKGIKKVLSNNTKLCISFPNPVIYVDEVSKYKKQITEKKCVELSLSGDQD